MWSPSDGCRSRPTVSKRGKRLTRRPQCAARAGAVFFLPRERWPSCTRGTRAVVESQVGDRTDEISALLSFVAARFSPGPRMTLGKGNPPVDPCLRAGFRVHPRRDDGVARHQAAAAGRSLCRITFRTYAESPLMLAAWSASSCGGAERLTVGA